MATAQSAPTTIFRILTSLRVWRSQIGIPAIPAPAVKPVPALLAVRAGLSDAKPIVLRRMQPAAIARPANPLARQQAPDQRQEEDRDVDDKTDIPQDRAQPRPVADISQHIGDAHDHEQDGELV